MIILKWKKDMSIDEVYDIYQCIKSMLPEEKILCMPEQMSYIEADLDYLYHLREQVDEAIKDYQERTYR